MAVEKGREAGEKRRWKTSAATRVLVVLASIFLSPIFLSVATRTDPMPPSELRTAGLRRTTRMQITHDNMSKYNAQPFQNRLIAPGGPRRRGGSAAAAICATRCAQTTWMRVQSNCTNSRKCKGGAAASQSRSHAPRGNALAAAPRPRYAACRTTRIQPMVRQRDRSPACSGPNRNRYDEVSLRLDVGSLLACDEKTPPKPRQTATNRDKPRQTATFARFPAENPPLRPQNRTAKQQNGDKTRGRNAEPYRDPQFRRPLRDRASPC